MRGKVTWDNSGKAHYYLNGEEVTEARFRRAFPEQGPGDGSGLFGWKPLVSDALAVHPAQVKEAVENSRIKGVPTDFQEDGRPIFRTRADLGV